MADLPDIVGREAERDATDVFLGRLDHGASAILFEGQPGIGKTTVWEQAIERTAARGVRVLSCRPAEAEAKLAFASLADLFEPVADALLPDLSEPQRTALEVALVRTAPHGPAPSARAVATAVLSALRLLTASAPVVLAVDDQQWLDRASASALAFALRRMEGRRVGVVATLRVESLVPGDPLGLADAFPERFTRVGLRPLGLEALHDVIRSRLGHVLARPSLRHVAEVSGGNPLFALEYARAMLDAGADSRPGDPLPVGETFASLVGRRIAQLPVRTRRLLLIASAVATPTIDLIQSAAAGVDVVAALGRAEQAGVIHVFDRRIRFAHPLLGSAVYSSASAEARQETHRRLADAVASAEERARHLALASTSADETVARALDHASTLAQRRGAPDAAGELQERAAELTPSADAAARRRRRTSAAEHFYRAGDRRHARALLESVLGEPVAGDECARALHVLGQIRQHEDSVTDAITHLTEAVAHAEDRGLGIAIRCDLAFARFSVGDLSSAVAVARDALEAAERHADPGLLAETLSAMVTADFLAGRGYDQATMRRALALEDRARAVQLLRRPTSVAGILAVLDGRLAEADRLLRDQCDWATARGEESELPFLLFNRARLEWWRGDFAAAERCAQEALTLSLQTGSDTMRLTGLVWRAAARGASGDVAGARVDFDTSRALVEKTGYVQGDVFLRINEAAMEISLGDAVAVERALAPLVAVIEAAISAGLDAEASGFGAPVAGYFVPDAVESLVTLDQAPRAAALLDWFADKAANVDRWGAAAVTRCRSLLAVAAGDLDDAVVLAEDAVARWRELEMPIELGRALVALGRVRRRRGERRLATQALDDAIAIFERHGAALWSARAAEDRRRIPIRRRAPTDMTPTEERVAQLVASGRTNREVAGTLFMSPKTVEATLTRVYGKLGIRSRAELGVRMLERRATPTPEK